MSLRRELRPFLVPDPHARRSPNLRYVVTSLYLDSMDLALFRMAHHGEKTRFKLRIRSYSEDGEDPVYFEIKHRIDSAILKRRSPVRRADMNSVFTSAYAAGGIDGALAEFLELTQRVGAGPALTVRYDREAYEAPAGEPTRVTFDTDLRYRVSLDGFPSGERGWRTLLPHLAIVEIKFTERCPGWIRSLVRRYELERRSIPKYGLSVLHALRNGECASPLPGHRPFTPAL